jgi:hypothetical protein
MPIVIPNDRLLDRKEVAELLQVSYKTLERRTLGTGCLTEIRYTGKVLFNPHQVLMHRDILWSGEKCDGRCKEALKPFQRKAEVQQSFRRKKVK